MLYYLHKFRFDVWGPLRLFEYQSTRAALAALIAFAVVALMVRPLFYCLRSKIQPQRDDALMGKSVNREKVPTMGGILIFASTIIATLLAARPNVYVYSTLTVFIGMSLVGLFDDLKKVREQKSDGISEKAKWLGLTLSALAGFSILMLSDTARHNICELWIPFWSSPLFGPEASSAIFATDAVPALLLCLLAAGFYWFVTVGCSNAVNLTDGLDGLAAGCALPNILSFGLVAYFSGNFIWSNYFSINSVPGCGELAIFCVALATGVMAFLWYNGEPAEIYMGDVGALGIGGSIGAVAVVSGQPFLLAGTGLIFVAEAGSVILQRQYFKHTKARTGEGKRLFKRAPIHHHYQEKGFRNSKIVLRMWMITAVCCIVALLTLKLR
ncbi:MAG: phospho-N-acetylmuramoyl-pentapeptide-transferase [Opitutales bacterium]|nr:phospho-N-acetylmuramoyl-pentapeptide-transferase [Opitutales bacterium]